VVRLPTIAEPRQGSLGVPMNRDATRRLRCALTAPVRPGGRRRLAAKITTPLSVPNRALRHAQALGHLPDGHPFGEQPRCALTLLGGEMMRATWPALGVHHANDAVGHELAIRGCSNASVARG